jgi:hypothetical protein
MFRVDEAEERFAAFPFSEELWAPGRNRSVADAANESSSREKIDRS